MSYILDALRKADAERERDPARGIHAQAVSTAPLPAAPSGRRWLWGAGGTLVALTAGYLAWPQPASESAAPAPVLPAQHAPTSPAPAVVTVAASVSPPAPLPAPVAVRAAPVREGPATVIKAAPAAVAAPRAVAPETAAPQDSVPAPAAPERILAVAELPPDVQRELPKLAISGGVHSENAAQRMLIVGGQVVNEGAELAPGVLLEQIRARTAVLRFRGFRYSVAY